MTGASLPAFAWVQAASAIVIAMTITCQAERRTAAAVWLGGDVHLGARGSSDLSAITAMMGGAAGVVNLEGPVVPGAAGSHTEDGRVFLANPADAGERLRAAGVVAASVANNHAADAGADGEEATIRSLRQGHVTPIGGSAGAATIELPGATFRFAAHTVGEAGLAATLGTELAGEGPRVVAFHTEDRPSYLPYPATESAVDAAIAAGADVVVVHGSHRVGAVERRGNAVIAWGLGNLVFDCPCTRDTEGLVLRIELSPGYPASILPIRAGLDGEPAVPAPDGVGILDLVEGLGRARLLRRGEFAVF